MNKIQIPPPAHVKFTQAGQAYAEMENLIDENFHERIKQEVRWRKQNLNPLQKAELRREIIQMVQKLSRLSKLIEIQGDVLNNVTNDWLEVLGSDLRAEDVTPAYRQAMRTRTSTFPLQPFELINAHRQLSNTSSTYVTNGVCPYCRGKGTVMVFDPVLKVDVEQKCIGAMHRLGG